MCLSPTGRFTVSKQNWTMLIKRLIRLSQLFSSSTDCVTVQRLPANQGIGRSFNSCYSSVLRSNSRGGRKGPASYWQRESCGANMWPNVLARPAPSIINWISVCSFFFQHQKWTKPCLCFNVISCLAGMIFFVFLFFWHHTLVKQ